MPLTPADVRNRQFSTTRLRPGYDEEEVDAFLDEVEAEFNRLIAENQELRAKLAECLRGDTAAVSMQPDLLSDMEPELASMPAMYGAPVQLREQDRRPEPMGMASTGHGLESVARVLTLAQQTADQAVAEARREADETLGQARRQAGDILSKARQQAEQIAND